jgi:hypothetical protein
MQKSDPAGTLRLLLSKKQNPATTSSEHTTSDSASSNAEINSMVRQDSLLLKLTTNFIHRDVLKQVEENPACTYSHLAFLKKLHNPLTDEITLGKVIQLGSIVDQYAKAVQKRIDNGTRLATQQQAQTMFYEKAQNDTMGDIVLRWNAQFLHFLGFFLSFGILDLVLILFPAFVGFPSYLGLSLSFYN